MDRYLLRFFVGLKSKTLPLGRSIVAQILTLKRLDEGQFAFQKANDSVDRGKLFHILKAYVKRPLPFLNGIVPGTSSLCSRTRENDLILSCRGSFAVHCEGYLQSVNHLQSGII